MLWVTVGYHRIRKIGRVYEFIIHLIFGDKMKSYSSHFKSILSTLYRFHMVPPTTISSARLIQYRSKAINNKLPLRFAKKAPQQFQKEETACECVRCVPPTRLHPCIHDEPQGGAESIGSQQVVVRQVSLEISKLCYKIWVGSWEGTDHFSFSPSRSRCVETLQNFGVNASLESRFCISDLYCWSHMSSCLLVDMLRSV